VGKTTKLPIVRFSAKEEQQTEDTVTIESQLTIVLNGEELVTMACSPAELNYLVAGFLLSEGLITNKDDIKSLTIDEENKRAIMETASVSPRKTHNLFLTAGGTRSGSTLSDLNEDNPNIVRSQQVVKAGWVSRVMEEFKQHSEVFKSTGCVHSAAIADGEKMFFFSEDVGRHNAIDKVFGWCLLNNVSTGDKMLFTSGRISSEMLLKAAKRNVPFIITKAAPTNLGIEMAAKLGVTLIGFVRNGKMNAYSHSWRVTIGQG
jgi:FdhD protein